MPRLALSFVSKVVTSSVTYDSAVILLFVECVLSNIHYGSLHPQFSRQKGLPYNKVNPYRMHDGVLIAIAITSNKQTSVDGYMKTKKLTCVFTRRVRHWLV